MVKPRLIKQMEYPLDKEDFSVDDVHKILFICIYNLTQQGMEEITLGDIDNYLSINSPKDYRELFERHEGAELISKLIEDSNVDNFDYYYNDLRKYSLLRSYMQEGISVEDILDLDQIDEEDIVKQRAAFDKLTIEEIIKHFDRQNLFSKQRFSVRDSNKSRKSGDGADELYKTVLDKPAYGYGLESKFLTTVTYGVIGGRLMIESRDSGTGKSRTGLSRLVRMCSPYLWNSEVGDFVPNPNGQGHSGLYIGTEMDIYVELEPIIWCLIAGIEESKFKEGQLTKEEIKRLERGIEYAKQMKLYLEDEEDFDINYLWQTMEKYKLEYNIDIVCLDYIELNGALAHEYTAMSRGMVAREDQILLNLSKELKSMAKKLDLFIVSFTQTNDEGRSQEKRDQTAVKGGKSISNKADFGLTVFAPTKKELELLEPIILKVSKGIGKLKIPNVCYTIYKNRWYPIKDIKIWGEQNLGTGEFKDYFCTDKYYNYLNIPKTTINVLLEEAQE